jgi:glucose/arabinose dehydrogenase
MNSRGSFVLTILLAWIACAGTVSAQTPTLVDDNLVVDTVVGGLSQPISIAFLASNDFLVLEKASGKVKRVINGVVQNVVVNGVVQDAVLDLAVNSNSERGLLGIALHPQFPTNPGVYLYWTCRSFTPPDANPFLPEEQACGDTPVPGPDSGELLEVPLLGNRVDRFVWNGSTLTFDRNLIKLRAFQHDGSPIPPGQGDAAQPARANHDGGVIRFGPDGKLYIIFGDQGRRGALQNLPCGPTSTCPTVSPDDQFGGPLPDNAHLSGVILRLNADGTTPDDNPFFRAGATIGGEVGANIQKIFAYGIRNSFGMAFDPESGKLWEQENGDDTFSELNLVEPGMNGGWVQIMGPVERIGEYKAVETSPATDPNLMTPYFGLQQLRWSPVNIANSPEEALSRLFMLPGAHYSDPEFSWKFEVSPAGIGFIQGRALGPQYRGDMIVGSARTFLLGGQLFRLNLTGNRRKIGVDDPRLEDRVADNNFKFDITESESLLFGTNFGVATDVLTGPNGNLFIVSLSNGAVYEISRR